MTNRFRRSMVSVLLAASLLFSSQSVIAFADDGSKSDTSDLSPVQESVENATEEQQEDPSLSVEPVIVESTEAPVAAPMMARANAPVAYSAPSVDTERYECLDMSFTSNCNSYRIDLYTTKNAGTIHEENQNVGGDFDFTEGIGFRTYKAVPNNPNEWVFDSWKTNVYFDGWGLYEPIEDDNIQGPANKWAFSMRGYDTSKYDGSDADVQLNAILPTAGIVIGHPLYYTLCANFNPLVTVNVGENGTVTYNNTEVSHKDSGKKVEVEYGTAPGFTIDPVDGYKVASVTFGDTTIQANEDGTYPLPPVTEPTTLEVTFEPGTPEPTEAAPIHLMIYKNGDTSKVVKDITITKEDGSNYRKDETFNVDSLDIHKYYNSRFGFVYTDYYDDGGWNKYNAGNPNNPVRGDITLNGWTNLRCMVTDYENIVINAVYDNDKDNAEVIYEGKALHGTPLVEFLNGLDTQVSDAIKEGYTLEDGWYNWDWYGYLFDDDAVVSGWTNVYVKCFKNPDENIINNLLDVTLNCKNPDHPVEYGKSQTYSDLLPNSYTTGEVKNNDGTYTCDITVYPETYLTDYSQNVTKTNHVLVTTPENPTGIVNVTLKYENETWKPAESPVTFTVTCKESIPLTPSKPSDDVVKAIMDKISVTVDCTNTTGHDPMNHTLTGAEFTVGDIYSVAPFAGKDPVILCPVTINNYVSLQNGFITQYNAATNESHTLSSGFIPASIVLTYNKDAQDGKGAWENHDLENITLSLTCNPTTPGGGGEGTNPGGNGGDNDDDDDRYTGGNTVTRTINDDDVPLNDRPTNTTTIDDEDVPLADLPDDTVTIDDGEVPLKANPSTGDSLPFAAMAAAALSLGGVIVLNRKKK